MATPEFVQFVSHCVNIVAQEQGSSTLTSDDPFIQNIVGSFQSNFVFTLDQICEFSISDLMELGVPQLVAIAMIHEANNRMSSQGNQNIPLQPIALPSNVDPSTGTATNISSTSNQQPNEFFYSVSKGRFHHQYVEPLVVTQMVREINRRQLLLRIVIAATSIFIGLSVLNFGVGVVGLIAAFGCSVSNSNYFSMVTETIVTPPSELVFTAYTVPWLTLASTIYLIYCFINLVFWIICFKIIMHLKHIMLFSVMANYRKHFKDISLKTNIFGDRYLCITIQ